ncbi:MAG: YiiX/YebB-like N1pC/P60 family cysteine hydrolase, partial [Gallionella sp.]
MNSALQKMGGFLAQYLTQERHLHSTFAPTSAAQLHATLQVGDVLLVEGGSRVSTAIKFLTQSTWSHAALYVGDTFSPSLASNQCFVEVDMQQGVRACGLESFVGAHTRICRPFGLNESERHQVAAYAMARIGQQYDLRNITDLARFL